MRAELNINIKCSEPQPESIASPFAQESRATERLPDHRRRLDRTLAP